MVRAVVDEQRLITTYMTVAGCSEAEARSAVMYYLDDLEERPNQERLSERSAVRGQARELGMPQEAWTQ